MWLLFFLLFLFFFFIFILISQLSFGGDILTERTSLNQFMLILYGNFWRWIFLSFECLDFIIWLVDFDTFWSI